MFRSVFLILVVVLSCSFVDELAFEKDIESNKNEGILFVSLGAYCEMALRLRDCEVREAAFPFDWTITKSHELFIQLLEEDFQFFTHPDFFSQLENNPTSIKNEYYEIYFVHEWLFPDDHTDSVRYKEQLQNLKIKYDRRISRFRALKDHPGKVFFLRSAWFEEGTHIDAVQARELKDALERYFPHLDFTLVIVTYTSADSPEIEGIDRVLEFKIRRESNLQDFQEMISYLRSYAVGF